MTEMTRKCHPERSEGSRLCENDEILRFAQNDSKSVSFENLSFEFVSDLGFRISDLTEISE
jgi:hypothetical protein